MYDPVLQQTIKGLMFLGTSKLYAQSKLLVLVTSTLNEEDRRIQQAFDPVKDMLRSISWKKKKIQHSMAYGQLLIGDGCPLVCHPH